MWLEMFRQLIGLAGLLIAAALLRRVVRGLINRVIPYNGQRGVKYCRLERQPGLFCFLLLIHSTWALVIMACWWKFLGSKWFSWIF